MNLTIANARDVPECLDSILGWPEAEWGTDWALSLSKACLETCMGRNFPVVNIGLINGVPVGTCCLVENDLAVRPDLSPWVAGVYVESGSRKLGVGKKLVAYTMSQALALGFHKLFLFVCDEQLQNFYCGLGWTFYCKETFHGNEVYVMSYANKGEVYGSR